MCVVYGHALPQGGRVQFSLEMGDKGDDQPRRTRIYTMNDS